MELNDATIEAISQLARMASHPIDHPQGGKCIMRPDGVIDWLQPLDPMMTHVIAHPTAFDAQAIIAYVNRFKVGDSKNQVTTIFANPQTYKVRAVIDYHEGDRPNRCHHTIEAAIPFSEQWLRWAAIDGKSYTQMDFAEFLEENLNDIVQPEPAVFLDLVTNLQAKKSVSFESGVRLSDGSNQLVYAEAIEAKGRGTITVPSVFEIGVPIFDKGDGYQVKCLLRYRIRDGQLVFVVKVHRRRFLEQTAFTDICGLIENGTGLPIINAWA